MIDLKELWTKAKAINVPMFGTEEKLATLDFMESYLTNYSDIDRTLKNKYDFMRPYTQLENVEDTLEEFQADVSALLVTNAERLQRLWNINVSDYEPLDNWRKHEKETITNAGEDVQVNNVGARSATQNYGAQNEQMSYAKKTTDETLGAITEETANARAAVNSAPQAYTPTDKQNFNRNQVANKIEEGARQDSRSRNAYADSLSQAAAEDMVQVNYGKETIRELEGDGNIGIVMEQQMAEAEVKLWTKFSFYELLFSLIIKTLCEYHDNGYSTFRR